jgi:SAM-dependent methyltransferase
MQMSSKGLLNQLASVMRGKGSDVTAENRQKAFAGSTPYWEKRYARGGRSGAGSYGKLAEFKARILNDFVTDQGVQTVLEFGCGDGNQLTLANYPRYHGLDVSEKAISACRERFSNDPSKTFELLKDYSGKTAELVLSLDVIYHLVEDKIFELHMRSLFTAAGRFVSIYSSNADHVHGDGPSVHVRHRRFTAWVDEHAQDWKLLSHIPNEYPFRGDTRTGSFADFYFFRRR